MGGRGGSPAELVAEVRVQDRKPRDWRRIAVEQDVFGPLLAGSELHGHQVLR